MEIFNLELGNEVSAGRIYLLDHAKTGLGAKIKSRKYKNVIFEVRDTGRRYQDGKRID